MKKLLLVLGLAGVLIAPATQASFDTGTVKMSNPFSANPYTGYGADVTQGLDSIVGGNGLLGSAGSVFTTFCLEVPETFVPGATYPADASYAAVFGGYSGFSGAPSQDPISMTTAYLYSEFRKGTYGNDVNARGAMQQAVWYLEGELYVGTPPSGIPYTFNQLGALTQSLITAANAQLASLNLNPAADANGAFGVVVLNIYEPGDINKTPRQSQLAIAVPEPSTVIAGALLLLPFGASVLRTVRRNRAA